MQEEQSQKLIRFNDKIFFPVICFRLESQENLLHFSIQPSSSTYLYEGGWSLSQLSQGEWWGTP